MARRSNDLLAPIASTLVQRSPLGAAFSPWGALGEAFAAWLHYRVEVKRVEAEIGRVQQQAGVLHRSIQAQLEGRVAELCNQRLCIALYFETLQVDLHQEYVTRQQLSGMMQVAMREAMGARTTEDRSLWLASVQALATEVRLMGANTTARLESMARALPPVPHTPWQLPG